MPAHPTATWTLAVDKADLTSTTVLEGELPDLQDGEVLLKVDRVGVTANNVTYAVLGDALRYWQFFPTVEGLGLVPHWGFADVTQSRADGVQEGTRVYGYLPPASHLVVRPGRRDARGFRDATEHRAALPSPYNAYASTTGDATYRRELEDLAVLFRPLFMTSWMLADSLQDEVADVVALSSASSKTSYGTAFLLQGSGREVVGLTSPGNVAFTQSLGCYDTVVPYDDLAALPSRPTVHLDVAGSAELRSSLRARLGASLVAERVVGVTHQQALGSDAPADPTPSLFFAPTQMGKRTAQWGREEFDARFAQTWERFAPAAQGWVDVVVGQGAEGLRSAWLEVQSGRSAPRTGHVVQL